MPNELGEKRDKPNRNATDKLLAVPGVKEVIKMVRRYALKGAKDKAWVRSYVKRLPTEDADKFTIEDGDVDYDTADQLLESLAHEAGPEIARLWGLSENAGDKLAAIIYWGEDTFIGSTRTPLGGESYFVPFVLVIDRKVAQAADSTRLAVSALPSHWATLSW